MIFLHQPLCSHILHSTVTITSKLFDLAEKHGIIMHAELEPLCKI